MKKYKFLIGGPTSSGKSDLALCLARKYKGVIINADSMQLYKELRILTNRPSVDEMKKIDHKLYGKFCADQICSVERWRKLAINEIKKCEKKNQTSIIVGGSGLYLHSLIYGMAKIPDIPTSIKNRTRSLYKKIGPKRFFLDLAKKDRRLVANIHPNDKNRMIRSWEVYELTGRSMLDFHYIQQESESDYIYKPDVFFLLMPGRDQLYKACDSRFDRMLLWGAITEVKKLLSMNLDPDLPLMKALGVSEISRYIRGDITLNEASILTKTSTRRFAKRQMTWFRNHHYKAKLIKKIFSKNNLENILSLI